MKLNCNILDGNTPSVFLNGDHHEKIKAFEIELFKMTPGNIFVECINQTVPEYFKKWQESGMCNITFYVTERSLILSYLKEHLK